MASTSSRGNTPAGGRSTLPTEDERKTPGLELPDMTGLRRRQATVYDAVAGRVSTLRDVAWNTRTDEMPVRELRAAKHSTKNTTLSPEEVLFRRKEAPDRWSHYDLYMAHEHDLPEAGRGILPSSDLLKAIHSYTSHFYDALGDHGKREAHYVGRRNINEASMDETALLALGILLEEAGKEVLGRKGDLVFTEGEEVCAKGEEPEPEGQLRADSPRRPQGSVNQELSIRIPDRRKRRRLSAGPSTM